MKDQITQLLGLKDYLPSNVPELLEQLNLPRSSQQELQHDLLELEHSGTIVRIKGNRYVQSNEADLIPGRIRMNRKGKGFLIPDDSTLKEIAIPESATGTALHEDHVLVRRNVRARGRVAEGGELQETGAVIRILKRRRTQIVGTLQRSRQFLFVIPDDPRMPHDIYVPEPRDVGRTAHVGDKVVVELREWLSRHTNPEGEIIEVLGAPDAEGVDMLSVLRQYHLPLHFPAQVLDEAKQIGSVVNPEETKGRVDCRHHLVVTIDPDDAKDFDDAICLESSSGHSWNLWVHIADVSHYVKPGTSLDEEARNRGNSTYLVDRVIPMLPEALSNELCSLKPLVDRLTKCVEFSISREGAVLSTKFYPAIIHSKRRFSYREALGVLEGKATNPIEHMLHDASHLAQKIRKQRFKAGSLELDFPEMKIRLDAHGHVDRIEKVENDISHQLIEEFMLLANEAVATYLLEQGRASIHRVHEQPDARRLQEYREEVLSHQLPCGNLQDRVEVQKLLHSLGSIAIGPALKIGFLKSLMRARYAVESLGHYGLAKKKYAHFTSPIRRYADLVVHRSLFHQKHSGTQSLKEVSDHISDTERNSSDAERDSKDVKLFAYLTAQLESHQPKRYPALVTDLRNFGFFVDVPGLAMSGVVPLSTMHDDFYVFDPERRQLVGRRSRRIIRLGDRVEVQVAKVDRFKKQVDFCFAPLPKEPLKRPSRIEHRGDSYKTKKVTEFVKKPVLKPFDRTHKRSDVKPRHASESQSTQHQTHDHKVKQVARSDSKFSRPAQPRMGSTSSRSPAAKGPRKGHPSHLPSKRVEKLKPERTVPLRVASSMRSSAPTSQRTPIHREHSGPVKRNNRGRPGG